MGRRAAGGWVQIGRGREAMGISARRFDPIFSKPLVSKFRKSSFAAPTTGGEGSKHMRTGRVETGRMEFSDDWPGVFIRGDDALSFALSLRTLLHEAEKRGSDLHANEVTALFRISELAALLESCRATARRGRARSGRKDNG
jgi:hypothetical protein